MSSIRCGNLEKILDELISDYFMCYLVLMFIYKKIEDHWYQCIFECICSISEVISLCSASKLLKTMLYSIPSSNVFIWVLKYSLFIMWPSWLCFRLNKLQLVSITTASLGLSLIFPSISWYFSPKYWANYFGSIVLSERKVATTFAVNYCLTDYL